MLLGSRHEASSELLCGRWLIAVLSGVVAFASVVGCGTSQLQKDRTYVAGQPLERPEEILVYEFEFEPSIVDVDQAGPDVGVSPAASSREERVELGRKAAKVLAEQLVEELRARGVPAKRATSATNVPMHAILVKGRFARIDEGDQAMRTTIGLGEGAAGVAVHVEGFQQTATGLRRLGEGEVVTGSGSKPGLIVPGIGTAASGQAAGLAIGSAVTARSEMKDPVEAEARRAAETIADRIASQFQARGWL